MPTPARAQDKAPPAPWWREAWFLAGLLAVLICGLSGMAGAIAAFWWLRATGTRLPRAAAAGGAFLVGLAVAQLMDAGLRAWG